MGVNHSTPIPNPHEFDCQISEASSSTSAEAPASPDDTATSCKFGYSDSETTTTSKKIINNSPLSLSNELKCCEKVGQFYGITMYNDKHTNNMNLIPMTAPPVITTSRNKSNKQTENVATTTLSSSTLQQQQQKTQPNQNQRLSQLQNEEPFFEVSESVDDGDDDICSDIIAADIVDGGSNVDSLQLSPVNEEDAAEDCSSSTSTSSVFVSDDDDNKSCSYELSEGWRMTGQMDVLGGRLFLRGSRNELVAVVVRTMKGYVILGRKPYYEGQWPHRKIIVDDKFLYEWAIIKKKPSISSLLRLFVGSKTWIIERPKPSSSSSSTTTNNKTTAATTNHQYVANSCGPMFSSNMIRVNEVSTGKPCALVSQYFSNNDVLDSRWDLLVGPGVDPCLMVCFVGILNKSMGQTTP